MIPAVAALGVLKSVNSGSDRLCGILDPELGNFEAAGDVLKSGIGDLELLAVEIAVLPGGGFRVEIIDLGKGALIAVARDLRLAESVERDALEVASGVSDDLSVLAYLALEERGNVDRIEGRAVVARDLKGQQILAGLCRDGNLVDAKIAVRSARRAVVQELAA